MRGFVLLANSISLDWPDVYPDHLTEEERKTAKPEPNMLHIYWISHDDTARLPMEEGWALVDRLGYRLKAGLAQKAADRMSGMKEVDEKGHLLRIGGMAKMSREVHMQRTFLGREWYIRENVDGRR